MHQDVDKILFSLEVSKRYHIARRNYLRTWSKFLSGVLLAISASIFASVIDWLPNNLASIVAFMGALVVSIVSIYTIISEPSEKASRHHILADKFLNLISGIRRSIANSRTPEDPNWVARRISEWKEQREQIELDEPEIFCALHDLCYYEVAFSEGREICKNEKPRGLRRYLRHIWRFSGVSG